MRPGGNPDLAQYQWRPGQSGNPSGKAKALADMEAKARNHGDKALQVLASSLDSEDEKTRLQAAQAVLDRGFGKPAQAIVGGTEDDNPLRVLARIERVIIDAKNTNR